MDLELTGKVAIVTGGSRGIGLAIATVLAQEGMKVAIVSRDYEKLKKAAEGITSKTGAKVIAVKGDMTKTADSRRVVETVISNLGRIDVLVNNAGSSPGGTIMELTDEQLQASMNLKFMGHMRMCREVIPHMIKQGYGKIINVVGNDGVKPLHSEIAPSTANAADIALTIALAEHYGRKNITVNAINPGPVLTERWEELETKMARGLNISKEEARKRTVRSIPLGRLCKPEEVAFLVAFLASNKADFINGSIINIDGGQRKALLEESP